MTNIINLINYLYEENNPNLEIIYTNEIKLYHYITVVLSIPLLKFHQFLSYFLGP